MFLRLFSSVTLLCCLNVILTTSDVSSDICYEKKYVVHRYPTTWKEAFILCQEAGMEMAGVESMEEESLLENALWEEGNKRHGIGNGYWISASRRTRGGSFVWFNNGKPLYYSNFQPGQPDFAGQIEACVEVFFNPSYDILWNDYNCNSKIGYICQTYKEL